VEPNLITPSPLLVMEPKTDKTSTLLETPGAQAGEKKDTSESLPLMVPESVESNKFQSGQQQTEIELF